jgi:hypothetical protein
MLLGFGSNGIEIFLNTIIYSFQENM